MTDCRCKSVMMTMIEPSETHVRVIRCDCRVDLLYPVVRISMNTLIARRTARPPECGNQW